MKKVYKSKLLLNNSGFLVAEFLFAFVMVLGIGMFLFALSFSLATVEVAQYIVWSTARNHSAANTTKDEARIEAVKKFENLSARFPLLTGSGGGSSWFELSKADLIVGNLADVDNTFKSDVSSDDLVNDDRQPWSGASALLKLKLFRSLQIPFLGKVAENPSTFEFPIRAFILRHVSAFECRKFFYSQRYPIGIRSLESEKLSRGPPFESEADLTSTAGSTPNGLGEDNGC